MSVNARHHAVAAGVEVDEVELDAVTALVVERLATRLADAEAGSPGGLDPLDEELSVGEWVLEELAKVNQARLHEGRPRLSDAAESEISRRVSAEMFGVGPLQPLLQADVVDIDVNSHEHVWVSYRSGEVVDVGQLWESPEALTRFQQRLARRMGVGEGRLDTSSPQLTTQTHDGARMVLVLGGRDSRGIASQPAISIRRYVLDDVTLQRLAGEGLFPTDLQPFIEALVRTGFTIIVTGAPGAGKTTFVLALLAATSPRERKITVEKGLRELRLVEAPDRHPNVIELFTRQANLEGTGEVPVRQLIELSRRLNPDRVVVGELLEDESLDMLDAASMCARGTITTLHASSPQVAMSRLALYIARSNVSMPEWATWELIANSVDFIFHIDLARNVSDDTLPAVRRLTSITEIGGRGESGGVATSELWGFDPSAGRLRPQAPLSPAKQRRLSLAGYDPAQFVPEIVPWS